MGLDHLVGQTIGADHALNDPGGMPQAEGAGAALLGHGIDALDEHHELVLVVAFHPLLQQLVIL